MVKVFECETTGVDEGYEVPSGKVGVGVRFDSIAAGKSGRDRAIIEWFL